MFFKTPIIMAVLFIIFLIIILNLLKIKTNRKKSLFILVFLTIVMYFSFINQYFSTNILKFFGLDTEIRYNINSIHKEKGVILGLYSNVIMNRVQKPLVSSKEKVFEILENMKINEELNDKNNVENNGEEKIKPNVIMIMSESFFDPTVLSNVKFSEDPIPEIRKLLAKYTSGKIISSTFAGGTSNIEFEAFTGNSIAYLPYGTVPYTDLQDSIAEVDSLPKIMKSNGYKTIALHTYDKTFYNRDKNYANIGFDEFIGIDELVNPQYFGKYVSDETFVDNITQILEDNNEPVFIWGVTMQNHTPYNTSNYDMELKIEISGELLTEKAVDTLTAYSNGLYNSDRAMKKLIDYIELSTRPTIILFFGDHLPSLYDVYFDTGLISTKDTTKWTTTEMYNLHTIPFFIYDNFEYKTEYSKL